LEQYATIGNQIIMGLGVLRIRLMLLWIWIIHSLPIDCGISFEDEELDNRHLAQNVDDDIDADDDDFEMEFMLSMHLWSGVEWSD
jgi:hypothetical protein